jgi:hypothetical protein
MWVNEKINAPTISHPNGSGGYRYAIITVDTKKNNTSIPNKPIPTKPVVRNHEVKREEAFCSNTKA